MQPLIWEWLFSPPPIASIRKEDQKQLAFTWSGQQDAFIVLPQGYGDSPVLCHITVQRNLGHLDIQNITLIYSTDENMLSKPND